MQALRASQASSGAVSRIARADASHSAAASCQPTHTFALKVDLPPGETLPERVGSRATGAAAGAPGRSSDGRAPAQPTRRTRTKLATVRIECLSLGTGVGRPAGAGLRRRSRRSLRLRLGTNDGARLAAGRFEAALQRGPRREVGELAIALRAAHAAARLREATAAAERDGCHGSRPREDPGKLLEARACARHHPAVVVGERDPALQRALVEGDAGDVVLAHLAQRRIGVDLLGARRRLGTGPGSPRRLPGILAGERLARLTRPGLVLERAVLPAQDTLDRASEGRRPLVDGHPRRRLWQIGPLRGGGNRERHGQDQERSTHVERSNRRMGDSPRATPRRGLSYPRFHEGNSVRAGTTGWILERCGRNQAAFSSTIFPSEEIVARTLPPSCRSPKRIRSARGFFITCWRGPALGRAPH